MNRILTAVLAASALAWAGPALAAHHEAPAVEASDQDVSGGMVTAETVMSPADGWLVIHRTDDGMKPGPVIGHAWLKKGENMNVAVKLDEPVKSGDKLMLMLHGEEGGMETGKFEYTLGSPKDGPIKVDGKLVMDVITAK